jgi:hypothetical protein
MSIEQTLRIKAKLIRQLDKLVFSDFKVFMLEKWLISSGEHKGEKFGLRDAPFLLTLLEDNFRNRVIIKSAQSRISEIEMARALWKVITRKRNGLYVFPAGEQMEQFVDARVRPAVVDNPFLEKYVTGTLNLKKFGLAHRELYFRGGQKRRQIITVDASDLTLDEVDEYEDEGIVNTLTKRLGASADPTLTAFSTPKFHGSGISKLYFGSESQKERGSDQRVWTIQCEICGKWNEDLIWEENTLDLNRADEKLSFYVPNIITICRHCHKPLDRLSSRGEWVPRLLGNSDYCHGYSISKLFIGNANLNQIALDLKDPIKEQETNNSDLGRPFEPKGSRLTDEAINNARGSYTMVLHSEKVKVFTGIDIGPKIHAISSILEKNDKGVDVLKTINISECDSWEDVNYYIKTMGTYITVCDALPDTKEAADFQEGNNNVWLAYFSQHLEGKNEKYQLDWDMNRVHINRTLMMASISDWIFERTILFPVDVAQVRNFFIHLKSPIKAKKQDLKGNWITYYPKTNEPDHYYFALLYSSVASQLKTSPAKILYAKTIGRL